MTTPDAIMPRTFEQWRHCITVECRIELTPEYIATRLAGLQDDSDHYTQQFVRLYGEAHREQVLGWFAQAQELVGSAQP